MCTLLDRTSPKQMNVRIENTYWSKNENIIRLWYYTDTGVKYINLIKHDQESATLLAKCKVIDFHTTAKDGSITMYRIDCNVRPDRVTGEIRWPAPKVFEWDDLDITREMAYDLAQRNEYDKAHGMMGNPVVKLFNKIVDKITAA